MRFSTDDPFDYFLAPPPNESSAERIVRERQQANAQRVSDSIDEQLKHERAIMKKDKESVRIFLAGQSDSGKSTTLKNFRLKYARQAWEAERPSWKGVIQLNLLSNVAEIMSVIEAELRDAPDERHGTHSAPVALTEKHQVLLRKLGPLKSVMRDLKLQLGAKIDDNMSTAEPPYTFRPSASSRAEFMVRSWETAFEYYTSTTSEGSATDVIAGCREDMKTLWKDQAVQNVLKKRRVALRSKSGFFMDDIDRITAHSYIPTDEDILRARLKTNGVQEYRLHVEMSTSPGSFRPILNPEANHSKVPQAPPVGRQLLLYDVGGCRTQRHAWLPFFEGVHALLVLVPVNCFDERLEEDTKINKLEDSFKLWDQLCSTPLLQNASLILFLNKRDLLEEKMKTGIEINKFMTSYNRGNDARSFIKYLQHKFSGVVEHKSPSPRNYYCYVTSVVDTKGTSVTLSSIRDGLLRDHLVNSTFL